MIRGATPLTPPILGGNRFPQDPLGPPSGGSCASALRGTLPLGPFGGPLGPFGGTLRLSPFGRTQSPSAPFGGSAGLLGRR